MTNDSQILFTFRFLFFANLRENSSSESCANAGYGGKLSVKIAKKSLILFIKWDLSHEQSDCQSEGEHKDSANNDRLLPSQRQLHNLAYALDSLAFHNLDDNYQTSTS